MWRAELVSVDAATQTAVVKAPFREHMLRYIDEFHPGDKLNLTWGSSHDGEADDIIYLGRKDKSAVGGYGYVLTIQLVAVDKANKAVTFKVPVPMKAVPALKAMHAGDHVKLTSPFVQPAMAAANTAIAPA